ncbi:hypothetical protein GCM10009566_16000 [Streptomyces murinus]
MGAGCGGTAIPDGRRAGGVRGRGWAGSAGVFAGAVSTVVKGYSGNARGQPVRGWGARMGFCAIHGAAPRGEFRTLTGRHRVRPGSRGNFPPPREPAPPYRSPVPV